MLVITRRPGDEIVMQPSGIRVVFLGPRKDKDGHITMQGRIGIDAPKSEKILRGELAGHPRKEEAKSSDN